MHKKKGQLLAQPFIYIFALILGGLILVWGIKAIVDLVNTAGTAELGKMVKNIESDVGEFYNLDEGATKESQPLSLPKGLTYFCVSELNKKVTGTPVCNKKDKAGAIKPCGSLDAIDKGLIGQLRIGNNNIFVMPMAQAKLNNGKFKIDKLKPGQGDVLCYANGASITLTSRTTFVEAS